MSDATRELAVRRLLTLFTFDRKRSLERYARSLVINQQAFVGLISACHAGGMPFRHRAHYDEKTPRDVIPSTLELRALADNGPGPIKSEARKTIRKLGRMFREHSWCAGHMFYTQGLYEWHFFVFDRWDQASDTPNHWIGGSHVHFVNWLWPRLDPQEVWSTFVRTHERPGSALHIRDDLGAAEQGDEADER